MNTPAARPFLKWAGGKSQLLDALRSRLPESLRSGETTRYVEPFLGGGAVFFAVAGAFDLEQSYLFDINEELVLTYCVVQRDVEALIDALAALESAYLPLSDDDRRAYYYAVRERFNRAKVDIDYAAYSPGVRVPHAADLIFLNRTCYNGLFRVNSRGGFNVPWGRYKNPRIVDRANLRAASRLLTRAEVHLGDFTACERFVDEKTFVYIDPPYRPLSRTANFTSYARDSFDDDDQVRLAAFCRKLDGIGACFMLSNADPRNADPGDRFFDDLYDGFSIERVPARRAINRNGNGRGRLTEILVTNY
jgi:DNA adenine methylase